MSWFKKEVKPMQNSLKTNALPELPDLPELPELPPLNDSIEHQSSTSDRNYKTDLPALPSFPPSTSGEKMTKEIVKSEVSKNNSAPAFMPPRSQSIPSLPSIPMQKSITREISSASMDEPKVAKSKFVSEVKPQMRTEPVFVRIDKYQDALTKFNDIKKKLMEIESMLKDVKDIKSKEETQLEEWEQEIQQAKSKLDAIDDALFRKLDE